MGKSRLCAELFHYLDERPGLVTWRQGRCLVSLGGPSAEVPLTDARELFASMGYRPALAEAEGLLGEAEAAAL